MKKVLILIAAITTMAHFPAVGQEKESENTFTMGMQLRPRAEYRNGVLFPRIAGEKHAGFINNRARLSLGYQRDRLSMGMAAQHVGVWGQDPQIDKNGRFILNEAWANLDLGSGFFMKLGRQSLIYDDERILGGLDWNVAGRFHDALKAGYESTDHTLHLILAFNQNDEKIIGGTFYEKGAQPYKTMQTLWYQYRYERAFDISFLMMNLGVEGMDGEEKKGDTKYMQTMGTNLNYRWDQVNVGGTFYYQSGKNTAGNTISAYMWAVKAGWQFDPQWTVTGGVDYLSGSGDSEKVKAFDPLYGTHHKFYGTMDYFYASSFINGYNPGLWDLQVGLSHKVSPKVNLSLNYHYFMTASTVYDEAVKMEKGLGSEIDFQLDWNIMRDVRLSAGYSTMFGTKTMKVVKGGNPSHWQDWGWVSLNINPKVFITKW